MPQYNKRQGPWGPMPQYENPLAGPSTAVPMPQVPMGNPVPMPPYGMPPQYRYPPMPPMPDIDPGIDRPLPPGMMRDIDPGMSRGPQPGRAHVPMPQDFGVSSNGIPTQNLIYRPESMVRNNMQGQGLDPSLISAIIRYLQAGPR